MKQSKISINLALRWVTLVGMFIFGTYYLAGLANISNGFKYLVGLPFICINAVLLFPKFIARLEDVFGNKETDSRKLELKNQILENKSKFSFKDFMDVRALIFINATIAFGLAVGMLIIPKIY